MHRISDDAHRELVNWSRWCWLGDWPCEAASEPGWMGGRRIMADDEEEDDQLPPPIRPLPPDERRARIVQAAWARMDEITRKVLRAEYPARDGAGRAAAAAALHLTLARYEELLADGARTIEEVTHALWA